MVNAELFGVTGEWLYLKTEQEDISEEILNSPGFVLHNDL